MSELNDSDLPPGAKPWSAENDLPPGAKLWAAENDLPPGAKPFAAAEKPTVDMSKVQFGPGGYAWSTDPETNKAIQRNRAAVTEGAVAGAAEKVVGPAQWAASWVPSSWTGAQATQDKLADWERSLAATGDPGAHLIGSLAVDAATLPFVATKLAKVGEGIAAIPELFRGAQLGTEAATEAGALGGRAAEAADLAKIATDAAEAKKKLTWLQSTGNFLKEGIFKPGALGAATGYVQGATTARPEMTEEERDAARRATWEETMAYGAALNIGVPAVLEGGPALWKTATGKALTERSNAFDKYMADIRQALEDVVGKGRATKLTEAEQAEAEMKAAQAKTPAQEEEAAKAARALESIKEGRNKQVPVGRGPAQNPQVGFQFDATKLPEAQKAPYRQATIDEANAQLRLDQLERQTDLQNPNKAAEIQQQTAALQQAKAARAKIEASAPREFAEGVKPGEGRDPGKGAVLMGTRAESQTFDPSKLSETQQKVYERAVKRKNDAEAAMTTLRNESREVIAGREKEFASHLVDLKAAEEELKRLSGDVTPEPSKFDLIKSSLTPANKTRVDQALADLSADAQKTTGSVIERQEAAAAARDTGIEGGTNAMKILAEQEKNVESTLKSESGLDKIFEAHPDKMIPAKKVIDLMDSIIPDTAIPELQVALTRQKAKLEQEMDENGMVTPALMDSMQRFFSDAIDSGLVSVSGGTKVATGGERVFKLNEVRKEARKAIEDEIKEYKPARDKFAELAKGRRPFSVGNIFHGLTETEVGPEGAEKVFVTAPKKAMDQIVKLANEGKEGLAEAVKTTPELQKELRPYFNDKIFGTLGTRPVSGEAMLQKVEDNAKALKDSGLYDEFKQAAQERLSAEKQLSAIKTKGEDVSGAFKAVERRKELEKHAAGELRIDETGELIKRAQERARQVREGEEIPSLTEAGAKQVPGGVKYRSPEDLKTENIVGVNVEAKTKADIARLNEQKAAAEGNVQKLQELADGAQKKMKAAQEAATTLQRFQTDINKIPPDELVGRLEGTLKQISTDLIDDASYRELYDRINTAKEEYARLKDGEKFRKRVLTVVGSLLTGYTATASGFGRWLHNM